jgi:serine/threonine protein kinase
VPTDPLGLVGQVLLDRYRVDSPMAQGGMGVVYRGYDLRLRRSVCVKVFQQLSNSEMVVRTSYEHFVQEAFALSQLSHPNTLRIYDFGHLDDDSQAPFQVSELLEGGTLTHWVKREGPRPPLEMLELLEPVAGALGEAHARGIIHRDIKPSNIFLAVMGPRRIAKLGDFGIAKTPEVLRSAAEISSKGSMRLYSPGWSAPEQLRGEPPSPCTDVFSLGLVTAFVLGGRSVFTTMNEVENASERLDSDGHIARRVEELGLARPLAEVVKKACRALPLERYDSADLFATALREAAQISPRSMPPADSRTRLEIAGSHRSEPDDFEAESVATSSLVLPASSAPSSSPPPPHDLSTTPARGAVRAFLRKALAQEVSARQVIDCTGEPEQQVLGRRLVLLGGDQHDVSSSAARLRLTLLPSHGPLPRLNVKGLNCFVQRVGGRPAAAVDLDRDGELELLGPDRKRIDGVKCMMGRPDADQLLYDLGSLTLAVTGAPAGAVLLEMGPGREFLLVHYGAPAAQAGGHS